MRNNDTEQTTKYDSREKVIVHVGIWGIVVNFVYAIFKGIIGLASGSIAKFLDAINNLSDAISSIIAVGGTKLAMKPADKFHPFGHGRIEYVSAMAIAVLIVVVGIMSFVSAVGKIIHPTETHIQPPCFLSWLRELLPSYGSESTPQMPGNARIPTR